LSLTLHDRKKVLLGIASLGPLEAVEAEPEEGMVICTDSPGITRLAAEIFDQTREVGTKQTSQA